MDTNVRLSILLGKRLEIDLFISRGGPDLYNSDGKVVIEARMLAATQAANPGQLVTELQTQLSKMVGRLDSDFARYPPANHE